MFKISLIILICLLTACSTAKETTHQKNTTIEDDYAYGVERTWIDEKTHTKPTDQSEQTNLLWVIGAIIAVGIGVQ